MKMSAGSKRYRTNGICMVWEPGIVENQLFVKLCKFRKNDFWVKFAKIAKVTSPPPPRLSRRIRKIHKIRKIRKNVTDF